MKNFQLLEVLKNLKFIVILFNRQMGDSVCNMIKYHAVELDPINHSIKWEIQKR